MPQRPLLATDKIRPEALEEIGAFKKDIVDEVARTVGGEPLVVVGMSQNPFVKKARTALTDAGIAFKYLEYGSYLGMWKERLAIKLWSGYPTFPQVFVKGALLGGFNATKKAIDDGSLKKMLA